MQRSETRCRVAHRAGCASWVPRERPFGPGVNVGWNRTPELKLVLVLAWEKETGIANGTGRPLAHPRAQCAGKDGSIESGLLRDRARGQRRPAGRTPGGRPWTRALSPGAKALPEAARSPPARWTRDGRAFSHA